MIAKTRSSRYLLLGLLVFTLMSTPGHAAGKVTRQPRMRKVSLLYALNAGSGRLAPRKGKGARYELTLQGLDRNVTWFSDRPVRRTSSFPIAGLAKAWTGFGFAADPPNAALTYSDRSGRA